MVAAPPLWQMAAAHSSALLDIRCMTVEIFSRTVWYVVEEETKGQGVVELLLALERCALGEPFEVQRP